MNLPTRTLGLVLLMAMPLAAQQPMTADSEHHAHGDMMMEHGMMGPGMSDMMMMMGNMEYSPEHLLAMNGELSLTAQQIMALTALRDQAKKSRDGTMDKMKAH